MLRRGATGILQISEIKKGVVMVTQTATRDLQDKTFVYLVDENNKVRKQHIEISDKAKDQYIIKEGVCAGDRIVLSVVDKFTDGLEILLAILLILQSFIQPSDLLPINPLL